MRNRCKKCHKYEDESPRQFSLRMKKSKDSLFYCRACRKIKRHERKVLSIVMDHARIEYEIQKEKEIEDLKRLEKGRNFRKFGILVT